MDKEALRVPFPVVLGDPKKARTLVVLPSRRDVAQAVPGAPIDGNVPAAEQDGSDVAYDTRAGPRRADAPLLEVLAAFPARRALVPTGATKPAILGACHAPLVPPLRSLVAAAAPSLRIRTGARHAVVQAQANAAAAASLGIAALKAAFIRADGAAVHAARGARLVREEDQHRFFESRPSGPARVSRAHPDGS